MNLVTRALPNDNYLWWIYGAEDTEWFWSRFQAGGGFYESQWLTISHRPVIAPSEAGIIDLSGNNTFVDPRDADAVTFDIDGRHMILPRNVEYFDSSLATTTEIRWLEHFGATTDGSLDILFADVGNHDFDFTAAIKDSSLHLGAGWDRVDLIDHRDIPGEQYWALIRRDDNELDAYSLLTGRRIRMEDGLESRNGLAGKHNFGEVEILTLADSRNGGTPVYKPGEDLPSGRGTPTNIDLRSDGATHTDSFNLAYFNFIRYTSDNVWVGEATIHDGTDYSTPSDRRVATDKNIYLNSGYGYDAPVLAGQLSVIGQSRNGTHDLIVAEQATAIDGKFRLYTFNVASELYNEFNEVFLGSGSDDASDKSSIGGSDWSDRVALYGFGGEDVLKGGAGRDYIFGGQSVYNQLNTGETGNQVTGGTGADYFGVGNTNSLGAVTGANSTVGTPSTTGAFHQGYATDVIMDWHAGQDTVVVLSNGVAVIAGLRDGNSVVSLTGSNTIDLRDYAAVATSDQDFDGARGGDNWDQTQSLDYIYNNQATRDANSITNEADRTVVNNGLIVARGLDGNDTLHASAGADYLYGNKGADLISLAEGGADRVYLDTFDASLVGSNTASIYVSSFDVADDQFFVNKRVIDSFYSAGSNRALVAADVTGTYTSALRYNPKQNYLHDVFYSPSIYDNNASHASNDGAGAFGDNSRDNTQAFGGADGTTFGIGVGMVAAGIALQFVPFGGIAGKILIASGTALGGAATVIVTDEHKNATFSGNVGNYLNVITSDTLQAAGATAVASSVAKSNDNVRFLDFFGGSDAGDGFVPVVEFTAHAGQGIYGYFALHSNTETFVFLVASNDNLVENSEAIKVAEINGLLTADDFKVYDGEADIYNVGVEPAVVIMQPTVVSVRDTGGTPDEGLTDDLIDDVQNPIEIDIQLNGAPSAGSFLRVYDGRTLIYDGGAGSLVNGLVDQIAFNAATNTFTVRDGRAIGTVATQSDFDGNGDPYPITQDNSFVLRDSVVNYSIMLVDGATRIPTRASSGAITVSGGNNTIDGGAGSDTLNITGTSDFLNSAADGNIVRIETILVTASDTNGDRVIDGGDDTPIVDLRNQTEGFAIYGSSIADSLVGGSGNDTFVGLGGQDTVNLGFGGADQVTFTYSDTNLGADTLYDVIIGTSSNDEIYVGPSSLADTDNDGLVDDPVSGFDDRDGDSTRLMYEIGSGGNIKVASGTELLVVTGNQLGSSGDLTQDIATALGATFDLSGLDGRAPSASTGASGATNSSVLFAVQSNTAGYYWVGRYQDTGNDDTIANATEIEVFAHVQSSNILDNFWLPTVEAPQKLSITLPADTGPTEADGSRYYTQNLGVTVTGLAAGHQVLYSLDGGANWTFNAVGDTTFNLSDNTSYNVGDIVVRAYDATGFSAPAIGTLIAAASLPTGNYSAEISANVRAVTTDNIAPNAPASAPDLAAADDNGPSNTDNITTQTSSLTFAGAVESYSLVEIYSASTLKGTATADASGNYSVDVSLALGRNTVTIKASDLAGNFSSSSPALEVIVSYQDISSGASLGSTSGLVQINNTNFATAETVNSTIYVNPDVTTTDTTQYISWWSMGDHGEVLAQQYGLVAIGDAYLNGDETIVYDAGSAASIISGMTVDAAWTNAKAFFMYEGNAYAGADQASNPWADSNRAVLWYWGDTGDGVAQTNELILVADRYDLAGPTLNDLRYVLDVV